MAARVRGARTLVVQRVSMLQWRGTARQVHVTTGDLATDLSLVLKQLTGVPIKHHVNCTPHRTVEKLPRFTSFELKSFDHSRQTTDMSMSMCTHLSHESLTVDRVQRSVWHHSVILCVAQIRP